MLILITEFPALEEKNLDHREKLELLISSFSNSQQDQYEIFRRSTFPKSSVRKIMQTVCGGTVPQNAVIAMAGITKVCFCTCWVHGYIPVHTSTYQVMGHSHGCKDVMCFCTSWVHARYMLGYGSYCRQLFQLKLFPI